MSFTTLWFNEVADTLSLDGEWEFSLGGQAGSIDVPGSWEAQGYPRRLEGPAIYRRQVDVPAAWSGRCIQLQFDAVSTHCEVTVNDRPVGAHDGAWSPFALDVTDALRPGERNEITVTVWKPGDRFPLRQSLVGFLPDVCLMFGGIWQAARLTAFLGPALSDLHLHTDLESGAVIVSAAVHHADGLPASVHVLTTDGRTAAQWQATVNAGRLEASLAVLNPQRWRPKRPTLCTLEIRIGDSTIAPLVVTRTFGFRALTHDGDQLLFNGETVFMRGALNWGWYPDALCPAPDDATIREEFRSIREMGFNLVKLCLFVPAQRYFEIADEEGMFLWLELPLWLPDVTPRLREQAARQYAAIVSAIHHHPSLVLISLGCELNHTVDADMLTQLNDIVRARTSGVLVCDNSGSGEAYGGLPFDFADFNDYHFYSDLQYFDPLVDHFRRDWRRPRPWLFGEFNDADDYRDLDEIAGAYGGELPWWLTEWNPLHPRAFVGYPAQRERMAALDLAVPDQALVHISRQQSFAVRKAVLEKVRARAGMGGYVVTGLRDTPLATSAVLDDLNRQKYPPDAFRAFNADTVLLLGRGRARRWTQGGDRPVPLEPYSFPAGGLVAFDVILAHAGPPLPASTLIWQVFDADGHRVADGVWDVPGPLAGGPPQAIGHLAFLAPPVKTAATLRLQVRLEPTHGQRTENSWALWIFPVVTQWPAGVGILDPSGALAGLGDLWHAAIPLTDDRSLGDVNVLLTSALPPHVVYFLRNGGAVILLQNGDRPLPTVDVPFWRESIKIIERHRATNNLPHDGFVDMQFYGLATDRAFDTARLETALTDAYLRPILRRLDARQFTAAEYLVEMRIGAGRMIASTLRFQGGLGDQPSGLGDHLAGRWLLYNLLLSLAER